MYLKVNIKVILIHRIHIHKIKILYIVNNVGWIIRPTAYLQIISQE